MLSRFVQWVLSLIFPYHGPGNLKNEDTNHGEGITWDMAKRKELDQSYGGHDGTTWRDEE